MKDNTEYVANAFAAHVLLDNDDVYKLAKDGYDVFHIAQILKSDTNLLMFKMIEMNKMGYYFSFTYTPKSNFFRNISIK